MYRYFRIAILGYGEKGLPAVENSLDVAMERGRTLVRPSVSRLGRRRPICLLVQRENRSWHIAMRHTRQNRRGEPWHIDFDYSIVGKQQVERCAKMPTDFTINDRAFAILMPNTLNIAVTSHCRRTLTTTT